MPLIIKLEHNFSVKIFNAPHNKIRGHVRRVTNQIAGLWRHFARFLLWYRLSYQVFFIEAETIYMY